MDFIKPYDRNTWLTFLEDAFLPDDFRLEEKKIDYTGTFTQEVTVLGDCPSLGLIVFEIRHSSTHDARVGLSKDAFRLVCDYTLYNRALVLFVPQDTNETYRFSLVEFTPVVDDDTGRVKRKYTNPRRYSYLLGKDCKGYTPKKYLVTEGTIKEQTRKSKKYSALEDLKYRFSVEVLTKEFYDKLFDWYEWALNLVRFPQSTGRTVKLVDKNNEMHVIRLITRLIFVWFIKQKRLVPEWIFDEKEIGGILKHFSPQSAATGDYYNGILQNLFFATLNKEIGQRTFTADTKKYGNEQFGIKTYYRDRKEDSYFSIKLEELVTRFATVPFLNGGLFECLDKLQEDPNNPGRSVQEYHDGFSREKDRCAFVPDILFFENSDNENPKGLIHLFEPVPK